MNPGWVEETDVFPSPTTDSKRKDRLLFLYIHIQDFTDKCDSRKLRIWGLHTTLIGEEVGKKGTYRKTNYFLER